MFGLGGSKNGADGEGRVSRTSWFAAVTLTVVTVVSIFYLVAASTGARTERILDQGAYSDLQRIGREIDLRTNNLLQTDVSADRTCDAQTEVCVSPESNGSAPGETETATPEPVEPTAQTCRTSFEAPKEFGREFSGICERQVSTRRGRLEIYALDCPESSGTASTESNQRCPGRFEEYGSRSLTLADLGLERLSNYAIYNNEGLLAAQIDGPSVMPARLPLRGLQRLASEADIGSPQAEAELGAPVEFVVDSLRVEGPVAFAALQPQRPGGTPIRWDETQMAARGEDPVEYDGTTIHVLYAFSDAAWEVFAWTVGASDVWWADPDLCVTYSAVTPEVC